MTVGFSSLVCFRVKPVQRCCRALLKGQYVAVSLTLFAGASLPAAGAERSLQVLARESSQ